MNWSFFLVSVTVVGTELVGTYVCMIRESYIWTERWIVGGRRSGPCRKPRGLQDWRLWEEFRNLDLEEDRSKERVRVQLLIPRRTSDTTVS